MKDKTEHFMTTVKVSPKGQIVIPKEIRDMFEIESCDNLIIMADSRRGIAIQKQSVMEDIAKAIFEGIGKNIYPMEDDQGLTHFAGAIEVTKEKGVSKK